MALAPQFKGHRWGPCTAAHVLEIYLDYVDVLPYIEQRYPDKIQFLFRHQVQPWHPSSTIVHEASLAVERIKQENFLDFSAVLFGSQKQYFDESVHDLSRKQIYQSLAKHAESVGIPGDQFLNLLHVNSVINMSEAANSGNGVTNDLKWHIKLGRQNGIHVSPTCLWDGIIENSISSGWDLEEWKKWLDKKIDG
ncbi:11210_t:CDS:2 [Acaulospora morrowiae]|uniref:11210_t:CDS:1 n=1 Tax=Acaulospora morrowiae TaxID=94023 RepID=A0A9N8V973_9GLOM|nr:11210_t:CDS:2 [Acaulospora morrowiae]